MGMMWEGVEYGAFRDAALACSTREEFEQSEYFLVEKLAHTIAEIAVVEFGVQRAIVSLEKPGALRFARSVGVVIDRTAADFE